jgi:hypothetical protein
MMSWKRLIFPIREESDKADRFFEIALLLATVLSASIFQYLWSKYSFGNTPTNTVKLSDLSFEFKELTIPIIVLILLWLLKELISGRSVLSLRFKSIVKEFCWTFLGIFLAAEILSVAFLGFITNPSQLSTTLGVMLLFAFVTTFAITGKYSEYISGELESKKSWLRRLGSALGEHCIVFAFSYFVFVALIWLSALPAPT